MAGNKGGVAIRMQLGYSSIAFVNVHLAAHTANVAQRNSDYHSIMSQLVFGGGGGAGMAAAGLGDGARYPERLENALAKKRWAAPAHVLAHDVIVVTGDLNYRIDQVP